jgi:hypothetical protein
VILSGFVKGYINISFIGGVAFFVGKDNGTQADGTAGFF